MKKLWDALFLFSSIFMLVMFVLLFLGSLKYWTANYPYGASIDAILFYISVFAAIATALSLWIEGRIKAIANIWREIKGGKDGRRKKRKKAV